MKNVLITGANGGMGRATVKLFKQNGYRVFGLDCTEPTDFCGYKFYKTDLSSMREIEAAHTHILAECQGLDFIIHMAGVYDLNSLVEMSEQQFLRVFEANLFSCYRINATFMDMLRAGSRVVITTSELAPLDPLPFTGVYAVSKAALEAYAYSLRMELNLLGISVAVIRPGAVKTGLLGVSTAALDRFCAQTKLYKCNAKRFKKIVDSVESKSIPPEEIAKTALRACTAKRPRLVYNKNRNVLLRLLNVLPRRLQIFIIKQILK